MDLMTVWDMVDPKAVTSDELYGFMNVKTKEWKDGVLSVMMREMNKNEGRTEMQKSCHMASYMKGRFGIVCRLEGVRR